MSREIIVNEENSHQRQKEIDALKHYEQEQLKREKNSPFKSFIQLNKKTYKNEDKLLKDNPLAYRLWRFLANNMDSYNAIMISNTTLTEVFECSRTTIYRAIKKLSDENYIKIYKSGTSNIYALNDDMVWNSWGTNKKYSKFSAKVFISESEQDLDIQKEIKLKEEKIKELSIKYE